MIDITKQYPVPTHKTWEIVDSSKLSTFMDCPRQYFYKYVLGWRNAVQSNHLVFGEAWHRAMEVLLNKGYTNEGIEAATVTFVNYYRTFFTEDMDMTYHPKSPGNAIDCMYQYIKQYAVQDNQIKVMATEISGTVPISDTQRMTFRIDALIEEPDGIWVWDHKTQSRPYGSWDSWYGGWHLSTQMNCYAHAANAYFQDKKVQGVKVNAAFFQKAENKLIRVPVNKRPPEILDWLWQAQHEVGRLEQNFEWLADCKVEDDCMYSFPRNPGEGNCNCTKFGGCQFIGICAAYRNPLQKQGSVPTGMEVSWWDPQDREKDKTNEVHLK